MDKKEWAVNKLQNRYEELGRIPKKSDFDNETMVRIKGILGPWPRAVEEAGLREKISKTPHTRKSRYKEE
jgi:hypothetical protein